MNGGNGMSADNGIYILETKDQYRVAHLQAIENLSCVSFGGGCKSGYADGGLWSAKVVEMWGGCKYTRSRTKALEIAHRWAQRLPVCEYGVRIIRCGKTWKKILSDARKYARREMECTKTGGGVCRTFQGR